MTIKYKKQRTWESFFQDKFVPKEERKSGRKRFCPYMEAQETNGEVDGALAVEPDPGAGHRVDVHLHRDPDRF